MIARDRQKVFQMQVKQLMSGLTVVERRGKVQLKLRGKDQPTQPMLLPFDWSPKTFDDAYTRIRNICKLFLMLLLHYYLPLCTENSSIS